jgi:hypothetical protein
MKAGINCVENRIPLREDKAFYVLLHYNGEFDPGSGRTLAAGLTHASRRGFRKLAF